MIAIKIIRIVNKHTFGTDASSELVSVRKSALLLSLRGSAHYGWQSGDSSLFWSIVCACLFISSWFSSTSSINAYPVQISLFVSVILFMLIALCLTSMFRVHISIPFGFSVMANHKTSYLGIVILGLVLSTTIFLQYSQQFANYLLPLSFAVVVSIVLLYAYYLSGDVVLSHIYGVYLLLNIAVINFAWLDPDSLYKLTTLCSALIFFIYAVTRLLAVSKYSMSNLVFMTLPRHLFNSKKAYDRLLVSVFLSNYLEARFLPQLIELSEDNNPEVQYSARIALARIWGPNKEEQEMLFTKLGHVFKDSKNTLDDQISTEIKRLKEQSVGELNHHVEALRQVSKSILENNPPLINKVIKICTQIDNANIMNQNEKRLLLSLLRMLVHASSHQVYSYIISVLCNVPSKLARTVIDEMLYSNQTKAQVHLFKLFENEKTWLSLYAQETVQEYLAQEDVNNDSAYNKKLVLAAAKEAIEHAQRDSRSAVRAYAQWFLVHDNASDACAKLKDSLNDTSWFVRAEAISVLSVISKDEGMIEAVRQLSNRRSYIRYKSLQSLNYLNVQGLKDAAKSLSNDSSADVRLFAQSLLYL